MPNCRFLYPASAVVCLALLSACGNSGEKQAQSSDQDGREETQSIRNTESIGYSGDAIADKLDSALDANDTRQEELERAQQP